MNIDDMISRLEELNSTDTDAMSHQQRERHYREQANLSAFLTAIESREQKRREIDHLFSRS